MPPRVNLSRRVTSALGKMAPMPQLMAALEKDSEAAVANKLVAQAPHDRSSCSLFSL